MILSCPQGVKVLTKNGKSGYVDELMSWLVLERMFFE